MLSFVVATVLATAPYTPTVQAAPVAEPAASFSRLTIPTFEPVRYRPRRRPRDPDRDPYYREERRSSRSDGFVQIHGGFFDPEDDTENSGLFGLRLGTSIEDQVQIGFGADINHRGDRVTAVISETPLPGGGTTVRREELGSTSTTLMPMMAFLQFSPGGHMPFHPYIGIGGGYEVLWVSAEDLETGEEFDATYGGWGWQAWGGVAMPLGGSARLTGEVFLNQSEVEREVDDPEFGEVREIVDVDGAGARVGVAWRF
jgi:hypothetical protein